MWPGRVSGRGASFYPSPHPGGSRGRALPPPSPHPLEDHPHVGRRGRRDVQGPLQRPHMIPQCLGPHGHFPSLPRYTPHDPDAPLSYDDLFLPSYTTFPSIWYTHPNPPIYQPPQSGLRSLSSLYPSRPPVSTSCPQCLIRL